MDGASDDDAAFLCYFLTSGQVEPPGLPGAGIPRIAP